MNVIYGVSKRSLVLLGLTFVVVAIRALFLMIVSTPTSCRTRKTYLLSLMSEDKAWYDSQNNGESTALVASGVTQSIALQNITMSSCHVSLRI